MISIRDLIKSFTDFFKKTDSGKPFQENDSPRKWLPWAIYAVLAFCIAFMFPANRLHQFADMTEGSISTRRIVAPFDFEILKTSEEYNRDRELASREVYPVFNYKPENGSQALQAITHFFDKVQEAREIIARQPRKKVALRDTLSKQFRIESLDEQYWQYLLDSRFGISNTQFDAFEYDLKKIVQDIMAIGVLDREKERMANTDRQLLIVADSIYSFNEFYDLPEARTRVQELLNSNYTNQAYNIQIGFAIINYFMRPNYIYDEALYNKRISEAVAKVPLARGFVKEDEKIVDRNERITPEIRKKLISLASKMAEMGMQKGGWGSIFTVFSRFLFVSLLLFLLIVFLKLEAPDILENIHDILLISLIILLISVSAFIAYRVNVHEYLIPVTIGAMLMSAIYDLKIGYACAAVLSILVGALWGNSYGLVMVSFFCGVMAVILISRVRKRKQLISFMVYLAGLYLLMITAIGFIQSLPFREIFAQWRWGAINGIMSPIITYGFLIPFVESVFNKTTDFTLLELSNLNHPLLKRLSVQAPGTYHHSIIVGNLAEAAAQAVNANSLLARVGSYYHDVGKIEKAEYFVENQIGGDNAHAKLTPRMSALILGNHVKKGVELSDQYKLPQAIKDIVVQHQGTLVMTFFYEKAKAKEGLDEVNENDYRYPGPRPQTKEAAIVMLADAVEAASRALKDPNHSRLKGLIEELVDDRFQSGELDESPLTLKDLENIKESFLTILAGIFHTRLEYPDKEEKKTENDRPDEPKTEG